MGAAGAVAGLAVMLGAVDGLAGVIIFVAGCAGVVFDSLLGATLERCGWFGNDLVNFASTVFAAYVGLQGASGIWSLGTASLLLVMRNCLLPGISHR